jgi:hypothetical protein
MSYPSRNGKKLSLSLLDNFFGQEKDEDFFIIERAKDVPSDIAKCNRVRDNKKSILLQSPKPIKLSRRMNVLGSPIPYNKSSEFVFTFLLITCSMCIFYMYMYLSSFFVKN